MLFNSYVFMLAFLPLTLLGYFLLGKLPRRVQLNKVFLVLASFVFYGYNNPSYVPIIAGSILVNYALSQLMLSQEKKAVRLPLTRKTSIRLMQVRAMPLRLPPSGK